MPPCCVINKNSDKHCGNWALKNKSCCWVHRALEDSPIPTEREVLVNEAIKRLESDEYRCVYICRNGKRCSRNYKFHSGIKMCGQHWLVTMEQKDRGNILPESKPQKDSDSESDSESESDSDDPSYYARIKKA